MKDLSQLSSLASGWAMRLNDDIRKYCSDPRPLDKQLITASMKNTKDALDILEQELQKQGVLKVNKEK